jgi:ribosomal protein S18 acetylase RimI-like enzyme
MMSLEGSGSASSGQHQALVIREASAKDAVVIWDIIEPVVRAGATYALPRDMSEEKAIAFWFGSGHHVFVAVDSGDVLGTYFLRANAKGGGDHVANAGYITAERARGRGVARAMAVDSLERARGFGFAAMQYNFVIATNEGAIRLWKRLGFEIVGRLPHAFRHPEEGLVDVLVMHRRL